MDSKKCFSCNKVKILSAFYKHKEMADGHLNKCKECVKADSLNRYNNLRSDPDWVKKERDRAREKYHRLGYANNPVNPEVKRKAIQNYKTRYPEKRAIVNRVSHLRSTLSIKQGFEMHHWSYLLKHTKDVIILSIEDHNIAHRFLQYDRDKKMYRTVDGELLDTNLKHYRYISKMINFEKQRVA